MHNKKEKTNGLTLKTKTELEQIIQAFVIDRKAMNVSSGTLYFYNAKMQGFLRIALKIK